MLQKYLLNDMFTMMDSIFNSNSEHFLSNGLRKVISKPHNLYVIRDPETNEIKQYKISICYTPFKKEDVKVSILDKVLTIKIGTENLPDEDGIVYKNISSQCTEINLKLIDNDIDFASISAKCDDGILNIVMPTVEKKVVEPIEIKVD